MDHEEIAREISYHVRLLGDAIFEQLKKMAEMFIKRKKAAGNAESYAADSCRRFSQLFSELPRRLADAEKMVNEKRKFLSVADPATGEVIPHDDIEMICHLPNIFVYLPVLEEPDRSILKMLDKYIFQQLRGCELYDDEDGDGTMAAVPWDLTQEEVVNVFETIREARRNLEPTP